MSRKEMDLRGVFELYGTKESLTRWDTRKRTVFHEHKSSNQNQVADTRERANLFELKNHSTRTRDYAKKLLGGERQLDNGGDERDSNLRQ